MTTIFLAAITILLGLILLVLVYHLPEHRQNAFLNACLRIYWTFLVAAFLVSWALTIIVWEVHHHAKLPALVEAIPVFFLLLSFGRLLILERDAWMSKMQAVRQVVFWTLAAFGFLLFEWKVPTPRLFSWEPMTSFFNSIAGDTINWLLLLYVSYNTIEYVRERWHQDTKWKPNS